MATGYWIVKGDKTSCGGTVQEGMEGMEGTSFANYPVAVNGSKVSCGIHSGSYSVEGGHPGETLHGHDVASTLYSRSTCPCRAFFIPSQTWASHGFYQGDPPPVVVPSSHTAPQPEQRAQSARNKAAKPTGDELKKPQEKQGITLTIGVFFDGTGNNAINANNMLQACSARNFDLNDAEAGAILGKCAREDFGIPGIGAASYSGYYTNIHWLSTLYKKVFSANSRDVQKAIYIDGIGTQAGQPDSMIGQGLGISDTGVIAKTDKAIAQLADILTESIEGLNSHFSACERVIKSLQFDIFGFSRGAAASRHFANRIHSADPAMTSAISKGLKGKPFNGKPAGKIRFIGIFDTVAAIGRPLNGLNPHNADTGDVNIVLRPGVADKVFHITAAHECRFNFALNSVKPAWPELALPGVHSDIGGGYLPLVKEDLFLTRPQTDIVPLNHPGQQTRGYHLATKQLQLLDVSPCIAPILRTNEIMAETWFDDRVPANRYGELQKLSFAAMTLRDRLVKNDWSRVVLRVMLDAAQEAGVLFDKIEEDDNFNLPASLSSLCEKALAMGKSVRSGQDPGSFSQDELDIIAGQYIHCSANWNAIMADADGFNCGGASASEVIGFINRPDKQWRRTEYNMNGKKC
ncbi:phospholipase effector Tle1 domain-containing protein [Erwinia pyrifoliae]|uniref:phospholipase effector Tle1 domain-containing protein n=1 Tax=Erwinia pyrifoliae TaxID=79967 RepID=UPI00223B853E|nr:DUF2235 domain-containing protein [Erwinia pyrifoliae]MCT2387074.1 DUF2235 domain-containing protein [Erwinia pyrifoliae]MCU8587327.1 DUF2235 domain-containing protein [Erwinia pyrifoliae]